MCARMTSQLVIGSLLKLNPDWILPLSLPDPATVAMLPPRSHRSLTALAIVVLSLLLVATTRADSDANAGAATTNGSTKSEAEFWPFSSPKPKAVAGTINHGGDLILPGKTKILASGCPVGAFTALKRFQLTAGDMRQPLSISWSVDRTPLAASTLGFISPPIMSTFFRSGVTERIVFSIRCVDPEGKCAADIEAEFLCSGLGKDTVAGFAGVSQVPYAQAEKQVQAYKAVKVPSPGSLLQVAEDQQAERATVPACSVGDPACAADGSNSEGDQCCPGGTFISYKLVQRGASPGARSFTCERGWGALSQCKRVWKKPKKGTPGPAAPTCTAAFTNAGDAQGHIIYGGRTEVHTSPICPPNSHAQLWRLSVASLDGKQKFGLKSSFFGELASSTSCFDTESAIESYAGAGKHITVEITCLEKSKCAVKVGYVFRCVELSVSAGNKVVEPLSGVKVEQLAASTSSLLELPNGGATASGRIQQLKAKAASDSEPQR